MRAFRRAVPDDEAGRAPQELQRLESFIAHGLLKRREVAGRGGRERGHLRRFGTRSRKDVLVSRFIVTDPLLRGQVDRILL